MVLINGRVKKIILSGACKLTPHLHDGPRLKGPTHTLQLPLTNTASHEFSTHNEPAKQSYASSPTQQKTLINSLHLESSAVHFPHLPRQAGHAASICTFQIWAHVQSMAFPNLGTASGHHQTGGENVLSFHGVADIVRTLASKIWPQCHCDFDTRLVRLP